MPDGWLGWSITGKRLFDLSEPENYEESSFGLIKDLKKFAKISSKLLYWFVSWILIFHSYRGIEERWGGGCELQGNANNLWFEFTTHFSTDFVMKLSTIWFFENCSRLRWYWIRYQYSQNQGRVKIPRYYFQGWVTCEYHRKFGTPPDPPVRSNPWKISMLLSPILSICHKNYSSW